MDNKNKGTRWTKDEEEICKQLLLEGKTYNEISKILNKPSVSIKNKNHKEFKISKRVNPNDIIGKQFNYWTVIELTGYKNGHYQYLCECSCENKTKRNVDRTNLLMGNSKSCGCYKNKVTSERSKIQNKKYNKYEERDNYIIGYTRNDEPFYLDKENYEKVKNYCWHIDKGYVRTKVNNKVLTMHRLILDDPDGDIDHINHNMSDNRKENLRVTRHMDNMKNRLIPSNNTSGRIGVSYSERENRWKAYITVDKKRIHLGTYLTKQQAIKVRERAEIKYFKDYRYKGDG